MASKEFGENYQNLEVETYNYAASYFCSVIVPVCLSLCVCILTIVFLRMFHLTRSNNTTKSSNTDNAKRHIRLNQETFQDNTDDSVTDSADKVKLKLKEMVNSLRQDIEYSQQDVTERIDAAVMDTTREAIFTVNTGVNCLRRDMESSQMVVAERIDTAIIDSTLEVKSTIRTEVEMLRHSIESSQIELTDNVDNAVVDGVREVKSAIHTGLESMGRDIRRVQNESNAALLNVERNIISHMDLKFECSEMKQEDDYAQDCEELLRRLQQHYLDTLCHVPVSPLVQSHDMKILDFFVPQCVKLILYKKGGKQRQTLLVNTYRDIFCLGNKLHRRVFIQGEPGVGKSTFIAKLVLDWCRADSVLSQHTMETVSFCDVKTLKNFRFLFHISLRDSREQREVLEMIKEQIIDRIYAGERREKAYKLIGNILEKEVCCVEMDGLDEWTDFKKKLAVPLVATCYAQCTVLITTRPWKMVDERIKDSHVDCLLEIEGIKEPDKLIELILTNLHHEEPMKGCVQVSEYINKCNMAQFLASPMLITLLVCLWKDSVKVNGSICEIYSNLLDILFKKANDKIGYFHSPPARCFTNMSYLRPNVAIVDALAKAAFHFLFANETEKSLVFSERELLAYLTEEQKEFSLNAGVLSEKKSFSKVCKSSKISFLHETMQEFLAAYHIANTPNEIDAILNLLCKKRYCVIDMEHVFTFLCGLNVQAANILLCTLNDNDVNTDISQNRIARSCRFHVQSEYDLKYLLEEYDSRTIYQCLQQLVIIAGYNEAKANGHEDIHLFLMDFLFSDNLNGNETAALKDLLVANKSNVRSLITDNNALQINEVLEVLICSARCIETFCSSGRPELYEALGNTNVQTLALTKAIHSTHLLRTLQSLTRLEYLILDNCNIIDSNDLTFPPSLKTVRLKSCRCSPDGLRSLLINLSKQGHLVKCELLQCYVISREDLKLITSLCSQSAMSSAVDFLKSCDMSNIHLKISKDSPGLYDVLRDTRVRILTLDDAINASMLSHTVPSLTNLAELRMVSIDFDRFDLQFPPSIKLIKFQRGSYSSDWLLGTLLRLSELGHPVRCLLFNCTVKSREETDMTKRKSDDRFQDLPNIKLEVKRFSLELYEVLRNTYLRSLKLTDVLKVSRLSETLVTLARLEHLCLVATNFGRSELHVPPSVKLIDFQRCSFSSVWLLTMLETLTTVDHTVHCILDSCVVKSSEAQEQTDLSMSNLRSKDLPCDISNIRLEVRKDNAGLFETLSGINIRMLMLKHVNNFSRVVQTLPTFSKLEKLYLVGGHYASFDLQPPPSMQLIKFIRASCPSAWLRRVLVRLSKIDHHVKCCLSECVVKSNEDLKQTDSAICDTVPEILPSYISNITLEVTTDSPGLYEALRGTSIRSLAVGESDNIQLMLHTVPTISQLAELHVTNAKLYHVALELPCSLRYMCLQQCSFSFDWLHSFLIDLSHLDHYVRCCLKECVVSEIGDNKVTVAQFSATVNCDCSMEVQKAIPELYETLRETGIKVVTVDEVDAVLPS